MWKFKKTLNAVNSKSWHKRECIDYILPKVNVQFSHYVHTNALLDSGCSLNAISFEMYEILKQENLIKYENSHKSECFTANKELMMSFGECVAKIKISNFSWNVKFFIIKDLAYKLILGSSFMKETMMVMDISSNQCYFKFHASVKIKFCTQLNNDILVGSLEENKLKVGCPDMQVYIRKLIERYPNVFTEKIGEAVNYEVKIELSDTEPVRQKVYPLSPPKLKIMREMTDDLLKQGIIEESMSHYSSPSFLVNKPGTDKYRLVINYAKLNGKIIRNNQPIGDLHESVHFMKDCEYFTVLDLCNSFYQLRISEDSKHITSFTTPYSQYCFKRVPYGLHLGSGVLSNYLEKIFHDIKFKNMVNFVDDIIVFSKTKEQHKVELEEVIKRLSEHNLTVNPTKVKFFYKEISFLGNLISKNSVTIDPERTIAIRNYRRPTNVKQVHTFIGMTQFFSKYIKNYAEIASPLNNLRKKKVKFNWCEKSEKSYQTLLSAISNPPVLRIADFDKKFYLMTDASNGAIGSVLLQENENGDYCPIAYFSKKLTDSEMAWSTYEKEAYSIVMSIDKFYNYLEVQPFHLITDNSALYFVLSKCHKLGSKLARWSQKILSLPFSVQHVKSNGNPVADALSRMFGELSDKHSVEIVYEQDSKILEQWKMPKKFRTVSSKLETPTLNANITNKTIEINSITDFPLAFKSIGEYQKQDPEIVNIFQSIKDNTHSDKYSLSKGVVIYKKLPRSKGQIYLPENLIDMVFKYYHSSEHGCHPGINRTFKKIYEVFYRPDLYKIIKAKVLNCDLCKMSKPAQRVFEGKLMSTPSKQSFERGYIDFAGPYVRSKKGNSYVLVYVDHFSKYTFLMPTKDCKSSTVIKKLEEVIFSNFSTCKSIVSDNATSFTSNLMSQYLFSKGIKHFKITPYKASGNICERYIRTVKGILKALCHDSQTNWDKSLSLVQNSLNYSHNEALGNSPFSIMFNHQPNCELSNYWDLHGILEEDCSQDEINKKLKEVKDSQRKAYLKNAKSGRYSEERTAHPFKVGDKVFLKTHYLSNKAKQFTSKLALNYSGPYRIVYFLNDVTVLLQDFKINDYLKKAHISQLKK